jgi:hypothetical protein
MSEAYIVLYRYKGIELDHIAVYTSKEKAVERLEEEVGKFEDDIPEVSSNCYATHNRDHEFWVTKAPLHLEEE